MKSETILSIFPPPVLPFIASRITRTLVGFLLDKLGKLTAVWLPLAHIWIQLGIFWEESTSALVYTIASSPPQHICTHGGLSWQVENHCFLDQRKRNKLQQMKNKLHQQPCHIVFIYGCLSFVSQYLQIAGRGGRGGQVLLFNVGTFTRELHQFYSTWICWLQQSYISMKLAQQKNKSAHKISSVTALLCNWL